MNPKERVLGKNGFEPFPKRIEEAQIRQGHKQAPADAGDPAAHDLPEHGLKGEAELEKNSAQLRMEQKVQDEHNYKDVQTNEMDRAASLGSDPEMTDPSAHDLPEHGRGGRAELSKKQAEQKRAQAEADAKAKK
jgi:hypothetical protein